jgi:hypothetical protein
MVPAVAQVMEIIGQPDQIAELLQLQVGVPKEAGLFPPVIGLDQETQNIQSGCLNPVAQEKPLIPGELLEPRNKPQDKVIRLGNHLHDFGHYGAPTPLRCQG